MNLQATSHAATFRRVQRRSEQTCRLSPTHPVTALPLGLADAERLRARNNESGPFFNQVAADLEPLSTNKVAVQFKTFKILGIIPITAPPSARGEALLQPATSRTVATRCAVRVLRGAASLLCRNRCCVSLASRRAGGHIPGQRLARQPRRQGERQSD